MDKNEITNRAIHYYLTNKEVSLRYVSNRFELSQATLYRKINGKISSKMGRPPVLSFKLDSMLARVLMEQSAKNVKYRC